MAAVLSLLPVCFLCLLKVGADSLERPNQFLYRTKCYGELGCFSTDGDFADIKRRPVQLLPESRAEVGVSFTLFDRSDPRRGRPLKTGDIRLLNETNFDPQKPLRFLIHGFMTSDRSTALTLMRHEFLAHEDVNIVSVNWENGAKLPYTQATANTRLVGAEIALLITFLTNNTALDIAKVHILGHSLGAHIAGYAGKYFKKPKIGRITGLDPAGPYFEGTKPVVRLNYDDADFVDVIHTNGASILKGSFGMKQAVGHEDIYFNGGEKQPGCGLFESIQKLRPSSIRQLFSCSHKKVRDFFRASISDCPFVAFRCADYDAFKRGDCLNCTMPGACIPVGLNATKSSLAENPPGLKYFLDTTKSSPYCGHHYRVRIVFSPRVKKHTGKFVISLFSLKEQTTSKVEIPHSGKWFDIRPAREIRSLYFDGKKIATDGLSFSWQKKKIPWDPRTWFGDHYVQIDHIAVYDVRKRIVSKFCAKLDLKADQTYFFTPC